MDRGIHPAESTCSHTGKGQRDFRLKCLKNQKKKSGAIPNKGVHMYIIIII